MAIDVTSPSAERGAWPWPALVLGVSLPLLLAIGIGLWRTPFPIGETVALLADYVGVSPSTFFDPTTRSWYRPLYHLTWWSFWQGSGSLDTALIWFKWLEIAAMALLVLLFIRQLRPRTAIDAVAAVLAVTVLVGMPGFSDNLEVPLLMTLVGMPIALVVWMLLEVEYRAWHAPLIVALLLVAVGFKEQGLVIAPVVVAAWWLKAPGARWTTAAAVVVAVVAYLALRLTTSGSWRPFEQDVGLGFTMLSAGEASDRFGAFPLWMYAHNAGATILNILLSEPTDGRFMITARALQGELQGMDITRVLSSALLTALIVWWGIGAVRRSSGWRSWDAEARVFAATVVAVAASGALGFNYSRGRLGGMAVVFYALAAYYALRAAIARGRISSPPHRTAVSTVVLILAVAWPVRALGTVDDVRARAARNHREWISDLQERRVENADYPAYVQVLNAMADQGLRPASALTPSMSFATAIAEGAVEHAYALIRRGQDPNAPVTFRHPDITGEREVSVTPLMLAVATGRDNAVSMLLSVGVRLDAPGNRGAVCLATQLEREDITAILIRYGIPAPAPCSAPPAASTPPLLAFVD